MVPSGRLNVVGVFSPAIAEGKSEAYPRFQHCIVRIEPSKPVIGKIAKLGLGISQVMEDSLQLS